MEVLTEIYRFRDCVIDAQARTVLRSGQEQEFEPKVFGLVTYLIQHRDRVVSKEELLEQVWGRSVVVTEGVLARAVMKCRRLIGDDAREPTLIKTIHRVGYRFVATLDKDPESTDLDRTDRVQPGIDEPVRIAVLSVLNETGEVEYAWIDLGMMSCTIDYLREGHAIDVISVGDVLAVAGSGDQRLALDSIVERLARALKATHVVRASLSRGNDRRLILNYVGVSVGSNTWKGQLIGGDPVELSSQLATAIQREIGRSTIKEGDAPIGSASFVLAVRGRALESLVGERWNTARHLLRVMLDLRPDDAWARRAYGRCLASLRDPGAEAFLNELLEDARLKQDIRAQTEVLHSMAILQVGKGRRSEAEQLLSCALELAEQQHDRESELPLLLLLAVVLSDAGTQAVATWMLDRAAQLAQTLGNQVASVRVADLRGRVAMARGDVREAEREFRTAISMCEDLGLHGPATFSLIHMGQVQRVQGRMRDAADYFDRALRQALGSGDQAAVGQSAVGLVYAGMLRLGNVSGAAEVAQRIRGVGPLRQGAGSAYADLIDGLLAARAGRFEAGLAALDRSDEAVAKPALHTLVLRLRIRMLICLGLFEDAEGLCEELQSCAVGQMQEYISRVVVHHRGLIAHASGAESEALPLLLGCAETRLPLVMDGGDPAFDAAWLCLLAGDFPQAHRVMNELGEFAIQALDNDYPPALHTMAALRYVAGDFEQAVALQRRYCGLGKVVGRGDSGRLLAAYEAAEAGNPTPLIRTEMLPSMWDLVPGLGRPQRYVPTPSSVIAADLPVEIPNGR